MELTPQPDLLGRVHLHCVLSLPISDAIQERPAESWPSMSFEAVEFRGFYADIQRLSTKSPAQNPMYQAGAFYYVLCQKVGSILRNSN